MKAMQLTQGLVAMVDDGDFGRVNQFKWFAKKASYNYYAARSVRLNGTVKTIYLHRFIMNCPEGQEVDHGDGNPLNNQRGNLEICSKAANLKRRKFRSKKKNTK